MFVCSTSITAELSECADLAHNIPGELPYWGFAITINLESGELRTERAMGHVAQLREAWNAMGHGTLTITGTNAQIRRVLAVTDLVADFHGEPERDDFTRTIRRITSYGKGGSAVTYQKFRQDAA